MDQLSFASLDYAAKKKTTKREVFLSEMSAVVPWAKLEAVIEPHYPKAGRQGGRRAFALPVMLRIYCLQQWYQLSDPGAEEALYDICSIRLVRRSTIAWPSPSLLGSLKSGKSVRARRELALMSG